MRVSGKSLTGAEMVALRVYAGDLSDRPRPCRGRGRSGDGKTVKYRLRSER